MSEQKKKLQRIYDLLNAETKTLPPTKKNNVSNNLSFFLASIKPRP